MDHDTFEPTKVSLPHSSAVFLERLTKEHKIMGVDPMTFQPYTIDVKNPILTVGTGAETVGEQEMMVWKVFVYDGDQFIGTYKFGEKTYKGVTRYPEAFERHKVETTV